MKMQLIFYLLTISFVSCSNTYGQKQGVVAVHMYLYEPDTTMIISFKIYYRNKQSIQQIPQLHTIEDSLGKRSFTTILHYSYVDPDKNVLYNYKNFSDTARVLKHYNDIDSIEESGGMNFYSNKNYPYDSLINLNDSIVDNVNYKVIKVIRRKGADSYVSVYFLRCDKTGTLIQYFKNFGDKVGCPIVRIDSYINDKLVMKNEIEFLLEELSEKELKVFDVWERNVKH